MKMHYENILDSLEMYEFDNELTQLSFLLPCNNYFNRFHIVNDDFCPVNLIFLLYRIFLHLLLPRRMHSQSPT